MLAAVFVLAVASAFAAASETTSSLSKEDLCQLVVLAARKEFVAPPHHTNLLAQPATSELAGDHGRTWLAVGVTEEGRSRYP
jgi:hypothetical protein